MGYRPTSTRRTEKNWLSPYTYGARKSYAKQWGDRSWISFKYVGMQRYTLGDHFKSRKFYAAYTFSSSLSVGNVSNAPLAFQKLTPNETCSDIYIVAYDRAFTRPCVSRSSIHNEIKNWHGEYVRGTTTRPISRYKPIWVFNAARKCRILGWTSSGPETKCVLVQWNIP